MSLSLSKCCSILVGFHPVSQTEGLHPTFKIKEFSDSATIEKMEDSLAKLKETYSEGITSLDNLEADLKVTREKIQDELNLREISRGFLHKIIKNPELWGLPPDASKKQVLNAIVGEIRNRKGLDNFPSFNDNMELISND